MKKAPTISLVIPAYNEERHLAACLDSVAAQSVMPAEVIVVDNNSSDRTTAVAEQYSFVKVVHEPRQGRVFARNAGFEVAKGDIIARVDADTVLPRGWVEYIQNFYAEKSHRGFAFTGGATFYNVRFPRAVAWLYNFMSFDFNHLLIGHPTLWGSNMAITRGQWRAVRTQVCKRNDIHEDLDLSIHLHRAGFPIFYDRSFRIGAKLRRVHSSQHELWDYLQWWPRTLRTHGRPVWVVCWLIGGVGLYVLARQLNFGEKILRSFGKKPLPESSTERI